MYFNTSCLIMFETITRKTASCTSAANIDTLRTVIDASIKQGYFISRNKRDILVYNCRSVTLKWLISSQVSTFRGCEPVVYYFNFHSTHRTEVANKKKLSTCIG